MARKPPIHATRVSRSHKRKSPSFRAQGAEVAVLIKLVKKNAGVIRALRQEVRSACDEIASQVEKNRRTLEIQFARISELQQEIDTIKRRQ